MIERVAVLLSGGASLGAVQVYPIEQIVALHGDSVSLWAGVSVGAQHAMLGAQGRTHRLRTLWREVDGVKFFMRPALRDAVKAITSLGKDPMQAAFTLDPLANRIKAELKNPFKSTCEVGVTDYEEGPRYVQIRLNGMSSEDIVSSMCASAAQPCIMQGWKAPVRAGSYHMCFDGGVKHVVPDLHDPSMFSHIYVIMCSPPTLAQRTESVKPRAIDGLLEVAGRSAEAWTDAVVEADVTRVRSWASLSTKVIMVAPKEPPGDSMDASKAAVRLRLDEVGPEMWGGRVTWGG